MKMIIGALALALAVPAAAQTAPAADPHAGHQMSAQMQGMDHSQHQQGKHDCKDCCDKMTPSGGKLAGLDTTGDATPAAPAPGGPTPH